MGNWVVSLAGPRRVSLEPCPTDPLGPGQVRVRTCYPGISAGTELTLFRGSNPRLSKDWDDVSRMFVPRQTPVPYPLAGFGYEEVGEIVEVADDVADRHPGQLVWGIWGHRAEAVDRVSARLERAVRLGARRAVDAGLDSAAAVLHEATAGRGADVCLELSGAYPALHEAIRATTHAGRVVAAGFYQGQADGLGLGEEFHHNRIQLVAAQVSGPAPAPGLAGRWSGARVAHTFTDLVAEGSVDPLPLVSHVVDARAVADALALLDRGAGDVLQVVLRF
ncbi:zinc-binding dehydrogenase [Micromonospora sp. NPDC047548]|uniref:zinc-binding dehydrogenase n=1 Tax=Micromonospora sp. NPDC047548 TaxID=3155624 RepID=UPI0033E17011